MSLLRRPLRLERRGFTLQLRLVDRRRSDDVIQAQRLAQLCADLRARFLAHTTDKTVVVMRHLVAVHDILSTRGWNGLARMSSTSLHRACAQAQMLASEEASPGILVLIDRLRVLAVAAEVREERERAPASTDAADTDVTSIFTDADPDSSRPTRV